MRPDNGEILCSGLFESVYTTPLVEGGVLLGRNMPVIAGGRMYLRTPDEMIGYDIKDPNAGGQPPKQGALGIRRRERFAEESSIGWGTGGESLRG